MKSVDTSTDHLKVSLNKSQVIQDEAVLEIAEMLSPEIAEKAAIQEKVSRCDLIRCGPDQAWTDLKRIDKKINTNRQEYDIINSL